MKHPTEPLPVQIEGLQPFVEAGVEISKTQLLHRIEGKVSATVERFLSLLQFYSIGKKEDGKLYLL